MNKLLQIFPAVVLLIAITSCTSFMAPAPSEITATYLAVDQIVPSQTIKDYLTQKVGASAYGGKVFSAYQIMGTEQSDQVIKLYLWALVQEYYLDQNMLKDGTGSSVPVVLFIKMQAGSYQIFDFKDAGEGYQYLTVNFPPEILPQINLPAEAYNQRVERLSIENSRAAKTYFGLK
jgi:hypothetical protein